MRYNSSRTGNTVHRASFPYRKPLDSNSHQRNDASRITARTFTPRESRAIEKASIERPGTGPQREFVPANRNLVASVFHPVPNHLNPIVPVHAVHRPVPEPVALNLPLPAELERRFGSPTSPAPFVTHVSLPHHSWSGPSTHPGMGSIKMEPKGEPISPWQDGPSYSVSQSSESPTGNGFAQWPGAVSSDAPTRRHVYGAEVTAAQHGAQHGRQAYRGRGTKHSTNGTRNHLSQQAMTLPPHLRYDPRDVRYVPQSRQDLSMELHASSSQQPSIPLANMSDTFDSPHFPTEDRFFSGGHLTNIQHAPDLPAYPHNTNNSYAA
ncbi:hypothetical protein EMMF5_000366 [Cystobasidiomycetes sp. EMM_F5]